MRNRSFKSNTPISVTCPPWIARHARITGPQYGYLNQTDEIVDQASEYYCAPCEKIRHNSVVLEHVSARATDDREDSFYAS